MEHRNRHATVAALALGLLAAALSAPDTEAQDQKVYRWVDEEGNVHYTESLPPNYKDTGHDVLNERGIVLDENLKLTPEREVEQKTEEQIKAEQAGELPRDSSGLPRPKPLYTEEEKQLRMDNFLMLRYDSEQEIVDAMNVEIKQLNYDRRLLEGSRESMHDAYRGRIRMAADKQRAGVPVTGDVSAEIVDLQSKLADNAASIAALDEREKEIRVEFQAQLDRYRYLVEKYAAENPG